MKKKILSIILSLSFFAGALFAEELLEPATEKPSEGSGLVYIIPVKGMIEPALTYVIRRGLLEAEEARADALILEMDTPGGSVKATEDIIKILNSAKMPSFTLVEQNAISAGAIIALTTDHIYMQPGSKIGDAMPIMAKPTGGVQPLPEAEREKITSYVDTIIRSSAEQHGHNVEVASAMVRREQEVIIDDVVISKEGQLLTMTNQEAERKFGEDDTPLLSKGTVPDRAAFLDEIGFGQAEIRELQVTNMERVARWIAAMAPFFMMGGMLGLYLEFKTPGFGLFGILGGVCLLIFFVGHRIAGLSGMEDIIILTIGIALLGLELFVLPGFGLFGITGMALIMISLLNAMIEKLPGDPVFPSWPQIEVPFQKMGLSMLLTLVAVTLLAKLLPKTNAFQKLVLQEVTSSSRGYDVSRSTVELLGQAGKAVTDLHPSGSAQVGSVKKDVITRGEYIAKGTRIKIIETHGNRIVVESDETEG